MKAQDLRIITFENGKKYKIGLMELFNSQATLD